MPGDKTGHKKHTKTTDAQKENASTLIATKLRGYYESIVEEGTPDHFLDLLERLDEAERKHKAK
ncbi:hypothetical protein HGO38_21205 [Rhizobium sp. CG5]|uniref:NepR family anti-sigma factor n=1 Tax=Rhizobium sp. CG5 TaxID=2726076 RepID=UPI0020341A59|nr:NepR family anti-sigma factor [Rhizobium sp. CG5]MCM2475997.1 hypothetical protein [Rhizobium sp. CG5]